MRRTLLTAALALSGCGHITPTDGFMACDVLPAGDVDSRFATSGLTQAIVNEGVRKAVDGASLTTDTRLNDQTANCAALIGYRVYTKSTPNWLRSDGLRISGETSCWAHMITIGSSPSRNWMYGSLIHELFHAMQHCESPPPTDPGYDDDHSNWYRDGIYSAIEYERNQP